MSVNSLDVKLLLHIHLVQAPDCEVRFEVSLYFVSGLAILEAITCNSIIAGIIHTAAMLHPLPVWWATHYQDLTVVGIQAVGKYTSPHLQDAGGLFH